MKKSILGVIAIFITMFCCIADVSAASYSISVGTRYVTKGTTTRLTIKGSDVTGRFNIKSSNPSVVSISEDKAWIENDSYSIILSGLNAGSATITVTPSGVSDGSGNAASLSAKTVNIVVSLPRQKSSDATLSSLGIEGYEITPKFDKKTMDYSVIVPSTVDKVKLNAKANSKYATLTGAGEFEVTEGSNALKVVVTAETGVTKTYTINVNVEDINPINVKIDNKEYTLVKNAKHLNRPDAYEPTTVKINDIEIPAFISTVTKFTLVGVKDSEGNIYLAIYNEKDRDYILYNETKSENLNLYIIDTPELVGYIKDKIKINNQDINVYKMNDNSRFVVCYAMNINNGKYEYYSYDTKEKTFQIYNKEEFELLQNDKKTYLYVSIGFAIALGVALVIIISLLHTNNKNKKHLKKILESKSSNKSEDKKEEPSQVEELRNEKDNKRKK